MFVATAVILLQEQLVTSRVFPVDSLRLQPFLQGEMLPQQFSPEAVAVSKLVR
jgi:hypothetical protein